MGDPGRKPFFGKKYDSIQEAFPTIDEINVRLEEHDLIEVKRSQNFDIDSIPGRVPCTNSKCTNEGIRLDSLVSEMVHSDETHGQFEESCRGAEKKGGGDQLTCPHGFEVEIDIRYESGSKTSN